MWVDREMDNFATRPQDPYVMTDEQRAFVRENIFPYWKGKSLEEAFLARLPEDTRRVGVDTGVIDSDSKWRQAVGEITPDYQDVLFKKGFGGIMREAEEHIAALDISRPEDEDKRDFYESVIWACRGIIRLAERYAGEAGRMAAAESDAVRAGELRTIAAVCRTVPANPPRSFREAIQFVWFTQLGGILSENPLALNPGRFDQYMDPYYEADGQDGTSAVTYMALKATEEVKTHQPGLSVRVHADCPKEFLGAVTHLVSKGTGFPAIHSDSVGYQMLLNLGYSPDDARDWRNCGCVVPHSRKAGE